MMAMLMMFAAFAIDIGLIVLTQAQLQNAADAAALSATLELKTADAELTQPEIKEKAILAAKEVALLNYAATRPVHLFDSDVTLGNRSYDPVLDKWVTIEEEDPGFGNRRYNTVRVNIAFDLDNDGPRRKLDLYFARVFDIRTARVECESRSHLTPRDLVFCIDTSGSMFEDTGMPNFTPWNNKSKQWTELVFGPIYGSARPDKNFEVATFKGNYELIWTTAMTNGSFGSTSQRDDFLAMEFPAYNAESDWPTTKPWENWKWVAFCDFAFCSSSGSDVMYKGLNGEAKNLNIITSAVMTFKFPNNSLGTPHARIGPWSYTHFIGRCGLVPAIRGQQYYPRDGNNDDVLDRPADVGYPVGAELDAPFPDYIGYYPRVQDYPDYDYSKLFSGSTFTGVYPNSVDAQPMAVVRQSTLVGLYSMIEAEDQGDASVAFNQVGLVIFGSMAYADLNLSNKLQLTLQTANSRLTSVAHNTNVSPRGPGFTNIGMGIKRSLQLLTDPDGRGRSFASKAIALLTDGEPTFSIQGSFDGEEYNPTTEQEFLTYGTPRGEDYARHWADRCGEASVTLHTIGLGDAGVGSNATFLENLADRGDGVFVPVPSVETEQEREGLRKLFEAIGKDKLGKLYSE